LRFDTDCNKEDTYLLTYLLTDVLVALLQCHLLPNRHPKILPLWRPFLGE